MTRFEDDPLRWTPIAVLGGIALILLAFRYSASAGFVVLAAGLSALMC